MKVNKRGSTPQTGSSRVVKLPMFLKSAWSRFSYIHGRQLSEPSVFKSEHSRRPPLHLQNRRGRRRSARPNFHSRGPLWSHKGRATACELTLKAGELSAVQPCCDCYLFTEMVMEPPWLTSSHLQGPEVSDHFSRKVKVTKAVAHC